MTTADLRAVPREWVPNPSDEFLHELVGDAALPWKETWFVNVHDLDAGFALSLHMTISPEKTPSTRVAIAARLGARETVQVAVGDRAPGEAVFGNAMASLEVVHSSFDSAHHLRLVGRTDDCSFSFDVRGHHWATLWSTMFPGFYQSGSDSSHSYDHVEQSVTFAGQFAWHDEAPVEVSGGGWRDRGWGRRRSTSSFSAGYDMVNGALSDGSVFTLMAFRNPDVPIDAPLPLSGWLSSPDTLTPAVSGRFWKDSIGWPTHVDLTFADGRAIELTLRQRRFSIAVPFHDAAHEVIADAHGIRDYFATFTDADGALATVHANSGHMHLANVTANAQFLWAR